MRSSIDGVRDMEELEGALLPTAQPFESGIAGENNSLPSATPLSSDRSYRRDASAVVIPSLESADDQYFPALVEQGTTIGRIEANTEKELIDKANRDAQANNYHIKHKIEVGNRAALEKQYFEESGQVQTSADAMEETAKASYRSLADHRPAPEAKGSFGGDYKVSEYEVKEYIPNDDYQVSEYKSVYDS